MCNTEKWNVDVFLYGVGVKKDTDVWPIATVDTKYRGKRGKVTTFSKSSSTRLRRFVMENFVPGKDVFSFTFTTRDVFSQEQWRSLMVRWNVLFLRSGWAGVWRVELQKLNRVTPHVHAIVFCYPYEVDIIKDKWLQLSGGKGDKSSEEYSVSWKPGLSQKWIMYLSGHTAKKKVSQLGWQGRHWGVWNRKMFSSCLMSQYSISEEGYFDFRRAIRAYMKKQGSKAKLFIPAWYRVGLRSDILDRLIQFCGGVKNVQGPG